MSDRATAEVSRGQFLLTVWASIDAKRSSTEPILRLASSTMRDGSSPVLIDDGVACEYLPLIKTRLSLTRELTLQRRAVSVSFFLPPYVSDINLTEAFAEISWFDESVDSIGFIQTKQSGDVWLYGRVKAKGKGDAVTGRTLTIVQDPVQDRGRIYPPSSTINASRFPDVDNDDDHQRAQNSKGLFPPITFASNVATSFRAPLLIVADAVDATPGNDLIPFQFLSGLYQFSKLTNRSVYELRELEGRPRWGGAHTITLTSDSDAAGAVYHGFKTSLVSTTTLGSPWDVYASTAGSDIISGRAFSDVLVGAQIRIFGDLDDDWRRCIEVISDSDMQVATIYANTNVPPNQIDFVRSPRMDPYPTWIECSGDGGVAGGWLGGPITHPLEAFSFLTNRSILDLDIHTGDLHALAGELPGCHFHQIINEDAPPLEWAMSNIIGSLPVEPWIDGGMLRFRLLRRCRAEDSLGTLDLDEDPTIYIRGLVTTSSKDKHPDELEMKYGFDLISQQYKQLIVGAPSFAESGEQYLVSGATMPARLGQLWAPACISSSRETIECPGLHHAPTAHGMAHQIHRAKVHPRTSFELVCHIGRRWIVPGSVMTVSGGILGDSGEYRCISQIRSGDGVILRMESDV